MFHPLPCTPSSNHLFEFFDRAVYISFGGLLMRLEGDPRHYAEITVGSNLYLLIRKI